MRKLIIIPLFVGYLFGLHGKITFFDGTYVVGRVTKVDESTVYIIPMGLDTAEGILVGNIDTLRMENGLVPVVSSSVEYVIIPNWSFNLYTGYPFIKASSFDYYDDLNPVIGL